MKKTVKKRPPGGGRKQRGGARPGAGRPKKEPTVVITRRVPLKFADQFHLDIDNLLKSYKISKNE